MRLLHVPDGDEPRVLASDVERAESFLQKAIGLIGRREVPEEYGLVFEFGRPRSRSVHMVGVRTSIDVVWLLDGEVTRVETLSAWTGHAREHADTFVELAPGIAAEVEVGDTVVFEE